MQLVTRFLIVSVFFLNILLMGCSKGSDTPDPDPVPVAVPVNWVCLMGAFLIA